MNQNTAAINALHEYAKIDKPGYAFMIEAPWGAGKTHLVKREFKDRLSGDEARYVSLNGVPDRGTFKRALLAETSEAKIADAAGKIVDTIGKLAKIGNVGSLIQETIEDRMISNLPDILIFDDIERCEMSPGELLGQINEFVEHQKKNVVLCAFMEREEKSDISERREGFLTRKEKVVGRTVKIVADGQSALPEFIAAMPDGQGKSWFQSNQPLVHEVFSNENHNNLRVLRQCLHDCGRVIDVLDEQHYKSTDGMIRFVRTYLVLSMSLATGEIGSQQLRDRDNYKCVLRPEEGKEPHPLFNCAERHPHAEIYAGNTASIISIDLGASLIGDGYEAPEKINEALGITEQFSGEQDIPLWRRFVEWCVLPKNELEQTHAEAMSYVFENEMIEPGPFLHLSHDLVSIAKSGTGNADEIKKKVVGRINFLEKGGQIPAAAYGTDYGWNTDGGHFSFGGYGFAPDDNTKPIIEAMRLAQSAAFEELKRTEADRLLDLLHNDLEAFGREFDWGTRHAGYYRTAILHEIDPNIFANTVFEHVTSGKFDEIGSLLKTLAGRQRSNGMSTELAWASNLKSKLITLAEKAGSLEKARMEWFLSFHWKFPTEY